MIHQVKTNPQLLDEQIFSERLASAISASGTWRHFAAVPNLVPLGGREEIDQAELLNAIHEYTYFEPTTIGRKR